MGAGQEITGGGREEEVGWEERVKYKFAARSPMASKIVQDSGVAKNPSSRWLPRGRVCVGGARAVSTSDGRAFLSGCPCACGFMAVSCSARSGMCAAWGEGGGNN